MGDEEGTSRTDPRVEYISARVQATFPKMVVSRRVNVVCAQDIYEVHDSTLHIVGRLPIRYLLL